MSGIGIWLEQLGLGKYSQRLLEHDVDFDVLSELNEQDLERLGFSFGDRRRLLKAIRELGRFDAELEPSGTVDQDDTASEKAERRQLTVLICDLIGSTELSEKLDPEDLRDVNRAFQDAATAAIQRYDGYVARYMGDGLLAYFGYPRAHEDDAERAVTAALHLVESVPADAMRACGLELALRVGIATGPVVVGDLIGEGASQESAVVGHTPNLAARLQALAPPNGVVVAPRTHELARQFEYADLGEHSLKGVTHPVRVRRIIGPRAGESRFEATHRSGLQALVGRGSEISLLMQRWEIARGGKGQVVLLCGEAGIGKSRIVQALCERIASETYARLRYQCSPYHLNSALYPVVSQLQFAAGLSPEDSMVEKLEKLNRLLAIATSISSETLGLFATLLSIRAGDRISQWAIPSPARKDRTLQALLEQLRGLAAQQPMLVIYEDVHWIDPTTSELLGLAVEAVRDLPALLLISFRPEFRIPWGDYPHVTRLALNPLTRRESEALVLDVTGGRTLPSNILKQILNKADGTPLFLEEVTKNLLETGLLEEVDGRFELSTPVPSLAIPSSLRDSLMARLDRLGTAKKVAQIGAVVGREFAYPLLRSASDIAEDRLQAALDQLIESELIFPCGKLPNTAFRFKHALVRDAAYESLLKSDRRQLHARIATVIRDQFPQQAEAHPEQLGRHFAEAGLHRRAVDYWQMAASRAIDGSANVEAIACLDEALHALRRLPEGVYRERREMELQVMKLSPLFPVKGYGSSQCEEASARALDLIHRVGGDEEMLFAIQYARWAGKYVKGLQSEAYPLSREYLQRAVTAGADAPALIGHRIHAVDLLMRGEAALAREHVRTALKLYDPLRHVPLIARFGQDLKVQACSYLALCGALLGYLDEAAAVAEEGLAQCRRLQHVNSLAYGLWHLSVWLPAILRDAATLQRGSDELLQLSHERKLGFWQAVTPPFLMEIGTACLSEIRDAEKLVQGCRARFNMEFIVPEHLCRIGRAYLIAGALGDARRVIGEARSLMSRTGELYWESEALRLNGLITAKTGRTNLDKATELLERAVAVARHRKLKLLELRATTDLARLWGEGEERGKAHAVLESAYEWFTEGLHLPDLEEAKTLIDEIS